MDNLDVTEPSDDDCAARVSSPSSEGDESSDHGVAMTSATLYSILNDNSRVFEFLRSFGLIATKCKCTTCGKPMTCVKIKTCKDGFMWRCRKDTLWRSFRKGTWFENSKAELKNIILLTYCFCMRKSVASTRRISGMTGKTVIDWFASCRDICSTLMEKRGKIGGPGVVVELGESFFYSEKYEIGRWTAELWLWGAVVCGKEHGELILKVVEKRNARALQRFIQEHVADGTVICFDKWGNYEDLGETDLQTFAAEHNYRFGNVTGTMDRHWKKVKRVLEGGKSRRNGLQSHLDEYIWRESVHGQGCVFHSFMQSVGALYAPNLQD